MRRHSHLQNMVQGRCVENGHSSVFSKQLLDLLVTYGNLNLSQRASASGWWFDPLTTRQYAVTFSIQQLSGQNRRVPVSVCLHTEHRTRSSLHFRLRFLYARRAAHHIWYLVAPKPNENVSTGKSSIRALSSWCHLISYSIEQIPTHVLNRLATVQLIRRHGPSFLS